MQILEYPFIREWCLEHSVDLDESDHLSADPALTHRSRLVFSPTGRSGHEPAVASAVLDVLGSWDECLLWITAWGIWPSWENWPSYYELRGKHGQRLSIDDAPGHLFRWDEQTELMEVLLHVLENGWDAILMIARGRRILPVRVHISHNGWAIVEASEPLELSVPGLSSEAV